MKSFCILGLWSFLFSTVTTALAAVPFPFTVTDLSYSEPGGISFSPRTPIVITVQLKNTGKAVVDLSGATWRITQSRGLVSQNPADIWTVTETAMATVTQGSFPGNLPSAVQPGTAVALPITFTPGKYGHFSLQLRVPGSDWYRAAGASVVYPPTPGFQYDSHFITGASQSAIDKNDYRWMDTLQRMGVKWIRYNFDSQPIPGKESVYDWRKCDVIAEQYRQHQFYGLMDIHGYPGQSYPRIGRAMITYANGNKFNLIPRLDEMDKFGNYVYQFMSRYGDFMKGVFCRNEPWETGSISNYHASGEYYRRWHRTLYLAAHAARPDCVVMGNDQITNLEDTFQPVDGMMDYLDVTSHHVGWHDNRGAVQSAAAGKPAWETEDWSSVYDAFIIANLSMKLAGGYEKSNPGEGLFTSPGAENGRTAAGQPYYPSASGQAVSIWLHFIDGTKFRKEVSPQALPHMLLFSTGQKSEKHAAIIFGRITAYGYLYKAGDGDQMWPQVTADGTLEVLDNNHTLSVYDISGNAIPRGKHGHYLIPLTESPYYITSKRGVVDVEKKLRDAQAKYAGNGCRAELYDFTAPLAGRRAVHVAVTNVVKEAMDITLSLAAPQGWELVSSTRTLQHVQPGERREVMFAVRQNAPMPLNNYPFKLTVQSANGTLQVQDTLHETVFRKGTITVDGNFDDWQQAGAVPVVITGGVVQPDAVEQYWFPFAQLQASDERNTACRFAGMWDDQYFYVMAEVNDATLDYRPSATRGTHYLMHGAPNDYLYWWAPVFPGTIGDALKIAFDIYRTGEKNDPWISKDYQQHIDTRTQLLSADYEYDLYQGWENHLKESYDTIKARHLDRLANPPDAKYRSDLPIFEQPTFDWSNPQPEIWRLMAPGVPRGNYYPFSPHVHVPDQGLVDKARISIIRDGNTWRYEAAIPWTELAEVHPKVGSTVRFSFYVINKGGRALSWTANRSSCQGPREILHPTWAVGDAIETRWGFAE